MHDARSTHRILTPATRLRMGGALAAVLLAIATAIVVVHAADGPYNTNPPYCRSHGPLDPPFLWFWFDCEYPDPPDWGWND